MHGFCYQFILSLPPFFIHVPVSCFPDTPTHLKSPKATAARGRSDQSARFYLSTSIAQPSWALLFLFSAPTNSNPFSCNN